MARTPGETIAKRYGNILNINHEINNDGSMSRFNINGFSFGDFTRTGKLAFWSILKSLEIPRLYHQANSYFPGILNASRGHFSKLLYNKAALSLPMTCTVKRGSIGKTSLTTIFELKSTITGEFLASVERQYVHIDLKTRNPKPLPEKYLQQGKEVNKPFRVDTSTRPEAGYHVYVYKVAGSDMDNMYHANQANYHKFCLDAAYDAGKVGFLQNFHWDICEYEVAEVSARHTGEAHAGDRLEVCVWEPVHDTLSLMFEIRKQDKAIFSSVMRFHSLNDSHL